MTEEPNDPKCVFCRIAQGELESERVLEQDDVLAFRDLNPQAPSHILVIPRRHIPAVAKLQEGDGEVAGRLLLAAREVAEAEGLEEGGYRLVVNQGRDGGQTVDHLHLHVLGGRPMRWPPG